MAEQDQNQDPNSQQENQINIQLSDEVAEGTYANLAMIAHSNSEFVIDFIRMMPSTSQAKVKSRIIITPDHAVRFVNALKENIEKYEENHGSIKETGGQPSIPMNFGGTMGQA